MYGVQGSGCQSRYKGPHSEPRETSTGVPVSGFRVCSEPGGRLWREQGGAHLAVRSRGAPVVEMRDI